MFNKMKFKMHAFRHFKHTKIKTYTNTNLLSIGSAQCLMSVFSYNCFIFDSKFIYTHSQPYKYTNSNCPYCFDSNFDTAFNNSMNRFSFTYYISDSIKKI